MILWVREHRDAVVHIEHIDAVDKEVVTMNINPYYYSTQCHVTISLADIMKPHTERQILDELYKECLDKLEEVKKKTDQERIKLGTAGAPYIRRDKK